MCSAIFACCPVTPIRKLCVEGPASKALLLPEYVSFVWAQCAIGLAAVWHCQERLQWCASPSLFCETQEFLLTVHLTEPTSIFCTLRAPSAAHSVQGSLFSLVSRHALLAQSWVTHWCFHGTRSTTISRRRSRMDGSPEWAHWQVCKLTFLFRSAWGKYTFLQDPSREGHKNFLSTSIPSHTAAIKWF